jgi:predicted Zn-dependent protease
MTDAMVELAREKNLGDDALMGVLAHEAGHVLHRHGTRRVIELGLLNGVMALAFGDVSAIANTVGTVMAGLAYSRSHEREADCFAIAFMQGAQRPLAPMADLLQQAQLAHGDDGGAVFGEWARTHPDTEGRVRDLKLGHGSACPRG